MCAWYKDKLILQPGLSDCGYFQGFVKPCHAAKYVQWLIRKLECQIQKCILCTLGPAPWDKKAAQNTWPSFCLALFQALCVHCLQYYFCTNFILKAMNAQGWMRLLSASLEDLESNTIIPWLTSSHQEKFSFYVKIFQQPVPKCTTHACFTSLWNIKMLVDHTFSYSMS